MKTIQLPAPKTLGTLTLEAALKARRPATARKAMAAHIEKRLVAVLAELYPQAAARNS